jgi:Uma2 family endonuclease
MAINTPQTLMTLDDLLARNDRIEIINGDVFDMAAAGADHQIIGRNIFRILDAYVAEAGTGEVLYDGLTFLMNSSEAGLTNSFIPDIAYLKLDNLPDTWDIRKPHPGTPDLAVEIFSPGNDEQRMLQKARTYLKQGSEQVWIVFPALKEVHQFKASDPTRIRVYMEGAMQVDDLFPGLDDLTVERIFALPAWTMQHTDNE